MDSLQMQSHDQVPLAHVSATPDTDETQEESVSSEDPNGYLCPRHGRVSGVPRAANEPPVPKEVLTMQQIQELELNIFEMKQELAIKTAALEQRDAELLEIQNNLEQLQENIESLNQDRLFYKVEYEKARDNEEKIQKDLEEVENVLKLRTEELEEYREKIKVNVKI